MAFRAALFALGCLWGVSGQEERAAAPRIRMLLGGEYWGVEVTPEYIDYLGRVRPDLIHASVLGPELASVLGSSGTRKAITPITLGGAASLREYQAAWHEPLRKIHALGIRVQATFSLVNVWGDPEQGTGWFRYWKDLWEEELLGKRPHPEAAGLLERDAEGRPLRDGSPGWYRYGGCVNNPRWRKLLKAMVKAGVGAGFDGFMVQFPHARGPCACDSCQDRFRAFLKSRHAPGALADRFGIADLDRHRFQATGPRPGKADPIDVEARLFGALSVKECFDDVFVRTGRSLKPDLIVSLWTHFRQFLVPDVATSEEMTNTDFSSWMDERALLPQDRWGRDEDYLWYSSPVYQTKLGKGLLGDNTLDYKFLRSMADDRPFHVLKYEYFRWRVTVGEALAHGGIAFGAWKGGWSGGKDREEPHLRTYFAFIRDQERFLFPRRSHAEVALLYPRTSVFSGDVKFFEPVRRLGAALMAGHVLFDFLIDEKTTPEALARYRVVVLPVPAASLGDELQRRLAAYRASGGRVEVLPDRETLRKLDGLSSFDAPSTVQIHADRQPSRKRLLVHLVNYNRNEKEPGMERPIAAAPVGLDLRLPGADRVTNVRFLTPEIEGPRDLEFVQDRDRLRLKSPGFLVYGLVAIEHE